MYNLISIINILLISIMNILLVCIEEGSNYFVSFYSCCPESFCTDQLEPCLLRSQAGGGQIDEA